MSIPFQAYFALAAVLALIALIQRRLYRAGAQALHRWFSSDPAARRARIVLRTAFLSLNLPWGLLMVVALSDRLENWVTQSGTGYMTVRLVMYPFAVWQFASVFTCLLLLAADGWRWVSHRLTRVRGRGAIGSPEVTSPTRRELLQAAGASLAALPFVASSYGAVEAGEYYAVEQREILVPAWPKELDGLRIAQLTDIHVGIFLSEQRLREVVQIVNRLEPALVVLTGDFVSSSHLFVEPCVRALAGLRAKFGVYASIGNHDVFTDSVPLLADGFRLNNIRLLYNEREVIPINGSHLNLVGIDFVRQDGRGYESVMKGIAIEPPTILLSHQPNVFPMAAAQGIDLVLSGHTHGGQVKFELLGNSLSPARLISRYIAGHYQIGPSRLYVSRGVGTTGPPVRINAPPEITILTLRGI